jgi:hypothetical protein
VKSEGEISCSGLFLFVLYLPRCKSKHVIMFHIAKHETNENINMCCLLVYRLKYIQQPVPMANSGDDTSNSIEVNNYFYWYHVIFHNDGVNFLNCQQVFYHRKRLLFVPLNCQIVHIGRLLHRFDVVPVAALLSLHQRLVWHLMAA